MRRKHYFELEDQPWFPASWREMLTDFLRTAADVALPYSLLLPLVTRGLKSIDDKRIIDLCAGAGGAPHALQRGLQREGVEVEILATDLFPNVAAFERHGVPYVKEPVDATAVPEHLGGFRTAFNALHHFKPELVRAIFADATHKRQPFLGVELVTPTVLGCLAMLPIPFITLVLTPLMRPFRWDRLFWTYVIPVVPFCTGFDGFMSCLRAYYPSEFRELTEGLDDGYTWEVDRIRVPFTPVYMTYVFGMPTADQRDGA